MQPISTRAARDQAYLEMIRTLDRFCAYLRGDAELTETEAQQADADAKAASARYDRLCHENQ
jgi:hypothetical protein